MATRTTTSLKIDIETKARLQKLAEIRRRTPHWLMREAISQYVAREEKREQFIQDAVAAWTDFEATGLHITQEEADEWLRKLAAGERTEPPSPHK